MGICINHSERFVETVASLFKDGGRFRLFVIFRFWQYNLVKCYSLGNWGVTDGSSQYAIDD